MMPENFEAAAIARFIPALVVGLIQFTRA